MNAQKPLNKRRPGEGVIKEEEVCVCFNLRRAARVITQIYDQVMRPTGYRGTQITLLGIVSRFQPVTVNHLAELIDTEPTTLLRNLRLLETNGLLQLKENAEDHRARIVTLSEKGERLLVKAYPLWKKTQDRIASQVGRKRLNQMLQDLQNTLDLIQKEPE